MTSDVLAELTDAIDRNEPVALLTVTSGTGGFAELIGHHCLIWLEPNGKLSGTLELGSLTKTMLQDAYEILDSRQHHTLSYNSDEGTVQVFVEVQSQPSHLVIVGAGHIAVPLAAVASLCDFRVTVLDDRPQYANAARFSNADSVIAGPLQDELRNLRATPLGLNADTYVVLVTRGHQHDVECLVELLDDRLAYIGMIGSQRRIQAVFQLLESERGIEPHNLDSVFAPIGLDIGARTPAEIAICIMAEIINISRSGPAVSLSDRLRQKRLARRESA